MDALAAQPDLPLRMLLGEGAVSGIYSLRCVCGAPITDARLHRAWHHGPKAVAVVLRERERRGLAPRPLLYHEGFVMVGSTKYPLRNETYTPHYPHHWLLAQPEDGRVTASCRCGATREFVAGGDGALAFALHASV